MPADVELLERIRALVTDTSTEPGEHLVVAQGGRWLHVPKPADAAEQARDAR